MKHLLDRFKAGEPVLSYHRMLMAENKWLAARYGLDAPLMDLSAGKRVRCRRGRSSSAACAS